MISFGHFEWISKANQQTLLELPIPMYGAIFPNSPFGDHCK
jgi:hypothetical protein